MTATEEKVQVKDESAGQGGSGTEGAEKTQYTMDELAKALEENPELRDSFIEDEETFLESHLKKTEEKEESEPKKDASEEKSDEQSEDVPKEVQVTIDKEWLSTYGKNRKPEEAIKEMSKGNAEKDKTIDFFKTQKVPKLESDLEKVRSSEASLKKQIEEFNKQKKEESKVEIPKIKAVDLDDEDLFLSDEGQKKFKESYAGLAKTVEAMAEKIKTLETPAAPAKETEAKVETAEDAEYRKEYAEIDSFLSWKKDEFGTVAPMELMESDYLDFVGNLAKTAGIDGPIQDKDGAFTPKVQQAMKTYLDVDSDQGKEARKAMAANNMPLLDEGQYNTLSKVYKVRELKTQLGVPYEVALELFNARNRPSEDELKLQGNIEGHKQMAKAKSNREQFVKQTPTTSEGGDTEILNMPVAQFNKLMARDPKEWTDQEKHTIKSIYKQNGVPDEEIKESFGI